MVVSPGAVPHQATRAHVQDAVGSIIMRRLLLAITAERHGPATARSGEKVARLPGRSLLSAVPLSRASLATAQLDPLNHLPLSHLSYPYSRDVPTRRSARLVHRARARPQLTRSHGPLFL
jgi:hypothetical protein